MIYVLYGCFGVKSNQGIQAPGMVKVAVRENQEIQVQQIDLHLLRIFDENVRIPYVE
jgi:hypothetical protein